MAGRIRQRALHLIKGLTVGACPATRLNLLDVVRSAIHAHELG